MTVPTCISRPCFHVFLKVLRIDFLVAWVCSARPCIDSSYRVSRVSNLIVLVFGSVRLCLPISSFNLLPASSQSVVLSATHFVLRLHLKTA